MRFNNYIAKFAICCASFFLFVFSYNINEYFDSFAQYAQGINLIFIPAGFKLLCVLLGGWAAVVGLLLSSVYMSSKDIDNTSVQQMISFAFASVGSYFVAVSLVKRVMNIDDMLSNLRYLHIIILSAAVSVLNGTVHNVVYIWQDRFKVEDFFSHSSAMIVGDFLGCFIVIMFLNVCIDIAVKLTHKKSKDEGRGIGYIAHLLNRRQA
jgi:integral membrane sensor domain MASE1